MKLTLRKANAVQMGINEVVKGLKFDSTVALNEFQDAEAVLQDMRTDINTPFIIEYDRRTGELDLLLKTIMRKKNFMTTNEIIPI